MVWSRYALLTSWCFFLDTLGTFRPCLSPQKKGGTVAIQFCLAVGFGPHAKQASDACFQSTNLSCPQNNRLVSCKSQTDFRSGSCVLYLLKWSWGLKLNWYVTVCWLFHSYFTGGFGIQCCLWKNPWDVARNLVQFWWEIKPQFRWRRIPTISIVKTNV